MNFLRLEPARVRLRRAARAALFFGAVMAVFGVALLWDRKHHLGPCDLVVLAVLCAAAGLIFGLGTLLPRRHVAPPIRKNPDDDDEGLGVPSRLIPPTPLLAGAKSLPLDDETDGPPARTAADQP